MQDAQAEQRLRMARPKGGRLALAWLLAGPLNPVQLIWIFWARLQGDFEGMGVFWFIGLPAGLAMTIVLPILAKQGARSTGSLFSTALFMWLLISLTIVSLATLYAFLGSVQFALMVFLLGTVMAAVLGLPGALVAAWLTRLIVFRKISDPAPSAQFSTP